MAAAAPSIAKSSTSSQTFVLVHGAWHGGWCWKYVADLLRAAGHRVFTPTLTGLGERHHLSRADITTATHMADIIAVVEAEELENVMLVGHSYGGVIISGVAEKLPTKIKRLIYLDALIPKPNEPLFVLPPDMAKTLVDGYRLASFPPEMFGVPKEHPRYAWVARRLTDMPAATMTTPVGVTGEWRKLPKSYIVCTANKLEGTRASAIQAKAEGWDYHRLATGHDAMVTMPKELAALVQKLARITG